jgi:ABC-type microcin C transport system permease subunit YejB
MNLVIKNMKYSKFASQETNCFECDIYFDGKKILRAFNDGRGGTTRFDEYIKNSYEALKQYTENYNLNNPFNSEHKTSSELIDDLVKNYLIQKDSNRRLKTMLKKYIVFLSNPKELSYYRIFPNEVNISKIKEKHPNFIILNCLNYNEALELFTQAMA